MCPENPLQNVLQNGSFWCPKIVMSSTKNGKAFSNPLFTTEWPSQPHFFHRMVAYTGVNPSHSMEEMARGIHL